MSKGLIYIAFGKEYEKLAAYSIAYSRKFTDLPISVITNIKDSNRENKWKEIENINFIYLDTKDKDNRRIKVNMIKYSPYEKNLYIDVDAVIQKNGVEYIFESFKGYDILLQLNRVCEKGYKPNDFFNRAYVPVFNKFNFKYPIKIYQGGFIGFHKNERTYYFFNKWEYYWENGLKGRDMPPLSCAVKESVNKKNLIIKEVKHKKEMFFEASEGKKDKGDDRFIIQHRWYKGDGFVKKFSLPYYNREKLLK